MDQFEFLRSIDSVARYPAINDPARMRIVVALTGRAMSFDQLKALLRLPDDRLMVHTHTLVREGWLGVTTSLRSGEFKPRATFALTDAGRASLSNYLGELGAMVKEIKKHVVKGETAASKSSGDTRYSSG